MDNEAFLLKINEIMKEIKIINEKASIIASELAKNTNNSKSHKNANDNKNRISEYIFDFLNRKINYENSK